MDAFCEVGVGKKNATATTILSGFANDDIDDNLDDSVSDDRRRIHAELPTPTNGGGYDMSNLVVVPAGGPEPVPVARPTRSPWHASSESAAGVRVAAGNRHGAAAPASVTGRGSGQIELRQNVPMNAELRRAMVAQARAPFRPGHAEAQLQLEVASEVDGREVPSATQATTSNSTSPRTVTARGHADGSHGLVPRARDTETVSDTGTRSTTVQVDSDGMPAVDLPDDSV